MHKEVQNFALQLPNEKRENLPVIYLYATHYKNNMYVKTTQSATHTTYTMYAMS